MILGRIVLDTNLLVFFVVGLVDIRRIRDHKRLKGALYREVDHQLLCRIVSGSKGLALTPHVLAETSNLLGKPRDPQSFAYFEFLKALLSRDGGVEEFHVAGRTAVGRPEYRYLGLTDAALLVQDPGDFTLITVDTALHLAALQAGRACINFDHIRHLAVRS